MGFTESGESGGGGGVPAAHALSHEDGGADSLDVTNLPGDLADPQVAGGIKTATTVVSVEASAAPTSGQILKASSGTLAAWANDSGMVNHDLGGVDHNADTLANLNLKVSDADLIPDTDSRLTDARIPTSHATTHDAGGADAMAADQAAGVASLRSLGATATTACSGNDSRLSDARTALAHSTSHENGGGDEISVAGLSGELADLQPPKTHASAHDAGGGDAMAIDAAAGTGSLRTLGTSATSAAAGNDSRLSDSRDPNSHSTSHENGGADELSVAGLSGELADNQPPKTHASAHLPSGGDAITTAAASTIGTANSVGTAESLARSDHGHDHGAQTTGTHHAAAISGSTNGFLTGADKQWVEDAKVSAGNILYVSKATIVGTPTPHDRALPYPNIQAAITAAVSGDLVLIGPGVYTITSTLTCKDGVSVAAETPGTVIIAHSLSADGTTVALAESMTFYGIAFFNIIASSFTNTLFDWGSATAHQTSTVRNCTGGIIGAGDGVIHDASSCAGLASSTQVAVQDCILTDLSTGGGIGYLGGGTAATLHFRMARTRLVVAGTASIGASVVGELSADNCYFEGVAAGVSCLTPSANNKFNYNQGTGWNSLTGGGTLARLWSSFDHSLQSNSVYVDKDFGGVAPTAIVNDRSRPFADPQNAINAASAGMVVYIGPGDYTAQSITCKNDVSVVCHPLATFQTVTASATVITMALRMSWDGGVIDVANTAGTSTGVSFGSSTANETSVLKNCRIIGTDTGTANGVTYASATGTPSSFERSLHNVTIEVDGVEIVPHATNVQYIGDGVKTWASVNTAGVIRPYVQYDPTNSFRSSLQNGNDISMFLNKTSDGGTGAGTLKNVFATRTFAQGVDTSMHFVLEIDERYLVGTANWKVVWANGAALSGGGNKAVRWRFEFSSVVNGQVIPSTEVDASVNVTVPDPTTAETIFSTQSAAIAASHLDNNHTIGLKLTRMGANAADTLLDTVHLVNIRCTTGT